MTEKAPPPPVGGPPPQAPHPQAPYPQAGQPRAPYPPGPHPQTAYPRTTNPYATLPGPVPAPARPRQRRGTLVTLVAAGTVVALAGAAALGSTLWRVWTQSLDTDDPTAVSVTVSGSEREFTGLPSTAGPTSLDGLYADLNAALAAKDRAAFFAHVQGDAVAPLTLWWDNMDRLGWATGAISPYGTADLLVEDPQAEVRVTLGTDLTYPQHRPALDSSPAGVVTLGGEYAMRVDTAGASPVVTGWSSHEPFPWDVDPLVAVPRDGVLVAGLADELAHLEAVADAAVEPSRWLRADHAARRGSDTVGGFVVFATQDATRFAGWWGDGSDAWTWVPAGFARTGALPATDTPGAAPGLATGPVAGGGATFLGPEAGGVPEDLAVVLLHEFAHVLQYVETPSGEHSAPKSTSEGWATYQELRFVNGGDYPDAELWFADYLGECVGPDLAPPVEVDFAGDGADCAYLLSSTVYAFAEEQGADPLTVADTAARDGVTAFGALQRLGTPLTDDAWAAWVVGFAG